MLTDADGVLAEGLFGSVLQHLAELIAHELTEPDARAEHIRDAAEHEALCVLLRMTYRRRGSRGVRALQSTLDLPGMAA